MQDYRKFLKGKKIAILMVLLALVVAAFGATIGIIIFGAGVQNSASALSAVDISNPYIVTICAFLGGSISAVIILALAKIKSEKMLSLNCSRKY